MIDQLWNDKRLENPFWEDVIRLLPRPLGTIEKAKSLRQRLEDLANDNPQYRGRLLGLAVAGVIENRDLFPDVNFAENAGRLAAVYETEGHTWRLKDRLLFLEGLGRLDPQEGDPRFRNERWFKVSKGEVRLHYPDRDTVSATPRLGSEKQEVASFEVAWAPVTVQEYKRFVDSPDRRKPEYWDRAGKESQHIPSISPTLEERVRRQMRHPNWPVVEITRPEALAFCRWRTAHRSDHQTIRLPSEAECLLFAKMAKIEVSPRLYLGILSVRGVKSRRLGQR